MRWNPKNNLKIWHLIIVGAFLLTVLILPGCNQSGYHTFTAKNRLCQFSLEYPRAYSHTDGPDLNEQSYFVTFAMPDKGYRIINPDPNSKDTQTVTVYHTPGLIEVYITQSNGYTSKTLIEEYLVTESKWANYNLLERSTIPVSGISAEYAHFASSSLLPMLPVPGEEIPLKHYRLVYFDYNDFIWHIEFKYEGEMAEQVKNDFEHLLETFKILD